MYTYMCMFMCVCACIYKFLIISQDEIYENTEFRCLNQKSSIRSLICFFIPWYYG